jgi:hypothetical protein
MRVECEKGALRQVLPFTENGALQRKHSALLTTLRMHTHLARHSMSTPPKLTPHSVFAAPHSPHLPQALKEKLNGPSVKISLDWVGSTSKAIFFFDLLD